MQEMSKQQSERARASAGKTPIPWFTVYFDSSTGLANALMHALDQKIFRGVGKVPESEWLARLVNAIPWKFKKNAYIRGSAKGAIPSGRLKQVRSDDFSQWVCSNYPAKKYPAIMIGSSNGAAIHLAAAMGIPWLPQTFLILVKTPEGLSVDDPVSRMEWARKPARDLLHANPGLQLHHMMDPNQDRPMLESTSYFRVKKLQLDEVYKNFIKSHLQEHGTILITDCRKKWPVTRVDERYYFQFGGLGGTSIEEYLNGSEQVKDFLRHTGAAVEKWTAPPVDANLPEAEWGFVPTMKDDLLELAEQNGYQVKTLAFQEPEDLSPYVADLYRWWYEQHGIRSRQLLAGMFFLIEPYLTRCSCTVPFWLAFNAKPSVENLKNYLSSVPPFEQIYLMPFNHGVKGQGLATIADYESAFRYALRGGEFIGSEPELYPYDFGIYFRYGKALEKKLAPASARMEPLSLQQLVSFHQENPQPYRVSFD